MPLCTSSFVVTLPGFPGSLSKSLLLFLTPQASALQRIQVVHSFDIFQMLGVLQDLRGTMAQQVSLLTCLFLLSPAGQVLPVCRQVSDHRLYLECMCPLSVTSPAVFAHAHIPWCLILVLPCLQAHQPWTTVSSLSPGLYFLHFCVTH